jgi:hypothetical protein
MWIMTLILLLKSSVEAPVTSDTNSFYGNKAILRDNFSGVNVNTSLANRPSRKADLRDTFSGTLDQTLTKVGSVRGYATRKNL